MLAGFDAGFLALVPDFAAGTLRLGFVDALSLLQCLAFRALLAGGCLTFDSLATLDAATSLEDMAGGTFLDLASSVFDAASSLEVLALRAFSDLAATILDAAATLEVLSLRALSNFAATILHTATTFQMLSLRALSNFAATILHTATTLQVLALGTFSNCAGIGNAAAPFRMLAPWAIDLLNLIGHAALSFQMLARRTHLARRRLDTASRLHDRSPRALTLRVHGHAAAAVKCLSFRANWFGTHAVAAIPDIAVDTILASGLDAPLAVPYGVAWAADLFGDAVSAIPISVLGALGVTGDANLAVPPATHGAASLDLLVGNTLALDETSTFGACDDHAFFHGQAVLAVPI